MAPVNKSKVFFCRDESCAKKFTDMSNRNRHEKRFNHKPAAVVKKRTKQPLYNHIEKKSTCALPGCSVKSNFKGNITRHMKDCAEQMLRKKKNDGNKVCEFCGKTSGQKYRDRHVKTQNEDKTFSNIVDESDNGAAIPTFVSQVDLQLENQTIDLSDQETPIYEVHDPTLNILLSPIRETDASTAHNETKNEVHGPPLNIPTSTIQQTDASETHNETSFSIGIELAKMAEELDHIFGNRFKESVLMKIKSDLKGRFFKHNAAKFFDEDFGEAVNDNRFLRWLAKSLDYKTYRLRALLKSYKQQQQTRHALSDDKHQQIYDYWLNKKVSIPTTDRRSGRDEIKIGKFQYLQEYKHLANI